jgi:hypothetical protein
MKVPEPGVNPDSTRDATAGDRRDGAADSRDGAGNERPGDAPEAGAIETAEAGSDDDGADGAEAAAPADAPAADMAPADLPPPSADLPPPPADLPPPAPAGCGSMAPDVSAIANLDALTIAKDGTIYFAQAGTPNGWVGRLRPGAAAEPRWVSVPEGGMLWGLTTDDSRQRLYVASASGHLVHYVSLTAAQPTLQVLTREVDEPDDLVVGPGGEIYFADSDNHLYRVSPSGSLNRVTTRTFAGNQATGLAFAADGTLLVGTMNTGPLFKLTLASGTELARANLGTFRGFARSLVVDAMGGLLVINQLPAAEAQVVRVGADGSGGGVLTTGSNLTALAFGRGALSCTDLYIASKTGPLRKIAAPVPGPAIP